ncbi:hypothetical protein V6N11_005181 [Hibiscus sabdariffa]|uniref:Polyprotein n=1 Tax=Hibiscus sabdariffa TaxID=183260 RepID=A0ABR2RM26_9ROSI
MLEAGQVPQPLSEEDLFQSIRRGPPQQAQPSIFSLDYQRAVPSQSSLFGTTVIEQKKPTTYEIYQLIKKQEAERKREREKRGKDIQDDDPSPKISKAMMVQKSDSNHRNPLSSLLRDYSEMMTPKIATIEEHETESSISADNEDSEDSYDSSEDRIMATNQPEVKEEYPEDEPMDTTTSSTNQLPIPNTGAKYNFTIDDIPVARWSQRFQEFHSWLETQKLSRESHYDILTEFVSRFTGVLRDWWGTVSPGDQMQFLVQQDFSTIIRILHTHFLGNQKDIRTLQRKEFFKRCCSFERKDLERHYNVMIKLFYALGADQSLKQVILSSIPDILQNAIDRNLQRSGKHVFQLTVGEIQQETFIALEELCDRKKTIKEYLTGTKELDKACKTTGLTIKCQKKDSCHCKRRSSHRNQSSKGRPSLPGITIPEDDDVESIFSIEDELSEQSLFAIQSIDEEPEDVEADWSSEPIYMLQHRICTNNISSMVPIPHFQAAVYLEKYDKPIPIIAFIDTGAAMPIMNPDILPKEWWKPHTRYFTSASDQTFKTTLISKPITIQFFPGCYVKTTVLGSLLPGKDLVMGFDLYTKLKHLRILPTGIKYKGMYKTFVEIPRLFLTSSLEAISAIVEDLKVKACSDSHAEFVSRCPHPLWKNAEFFVKLPFKKNEDINPTKASHSGMNPEHQKLAEAECRELLQQDLLEPSDSQWSCEAFYVNKRSEQTRGKLRFPYPIEICYSQA